MVILCIFLKFIGGKDGDSQNDLFVYTAAPSDRVSYTTSLPVGEDLVGTFACEARNTAGSSELCEISVNNPVAALAGVEGSNGPANGVDDELNYTYVAFGGGAVVAVIFAISLLSILVCRKRYGFTGNKYSLSKFRSGETGHRNAEDDIVDSSKPTSALINQCANNKSIPRNVGNNILHGKSASRI